MAEWFCFAVNSSQVCNSLEHTWRHNDMVLHQCSIQAVFAKRSGGHSIKDALDHGVPA